VFGLGNILQVKYKNEPDNQNIDVEKQHGNLDIWIISGNISGKGNEDNRNEQEEVNPEQTGIDRADKMKLAVVIQPETCNY
jgi:hypothetical protein